MDDLKLFLIITGVVLVIIIAVFTYFKNNIRMKGVVSAFDKHNDSIDDVLLSSKPQSFSGKSSLADDDLPDSFHTRDSHSDDSGWVDNTRPVRVIKKQQTQTHGQTQKVSIVHMDLPEGISDMVIAMSIQRDNHVFSGEEIMAACAANNLIYGDKNIFHFPAEKTPSTYALFSMANMVEPGTFDLDNMDNFTTPGISLFMKLPMKMNCIEAYNLFVERAKLISKSLNGDLYDERFNLISPQIISHTIEKINSFQHELIKAKKLEMSGK